MKFSSILSLASLASAAPYFHSNEGSPDALSVKLEMVGNSDVKASITNNGNAKLRLLKTGTILGNTPVEKVQVAQNGTILCPLFPLSPKTYELIISKTRKLPLAVSI